MSSSSNVFTECKVLVILYSDFRIFTIPLKDMMRSASRRLFTSTFPKLILNQAETQR